MNLSADIDLVIKRLNSALDQLEAASHRRAQQEAARANLEEELNILQDDRSRLAVELDGVLARHKTISMASQEVEKRLERTSATIRVVLEEADAAN